jgi:hypothetical protein
MRVVSVCKKYQGNDTSLLNLELDTDALHFERSSDNLLSHSGAFFLRQDHAVHVLPRSVEFMSDRRKD